MLIPLRHENMKGRRWPVITIGLIVLNTLIFLGTHWTIEEQQTPKNSEARVHILMLAAMHPGLNMPGEVQEFVATFEKGDPPTWKLLQNPNRNVEDGWDARMRLMEEPQQWQAEMDSLAAQFVQNNEVSLVQHYAFVPAHPTAISRLSANFLHAGWLHLIGNMWFLWLAGFILEDTWGRPLYLAFYLLSGVIALQVHAWSNPGSLVPTLGASGAVAALMGAFLVRYPNMKIEMAWIFGVFRMYRFKAAAYWLLPLWVLMEIFSGSVFGRSSGVAHWAHVGGFLAGAGFGLVIRKSGLESIAEQHIQGQIAWESHPLLARANEQLEKGELDAALENLNKLLAERPDSVEALRMVQQIYWRKSNLPAQRAALEKLIAVHLKAGENDEVMSTLQDYRNAGAQPLPAALWLDVCRQLEDRQKLDLAVEEYSNLAGAYPAEKQSLLALMGAARLCLKRLNRPSDALRFYELAKASAVPHGEWAANIDKGLAQSRQTVQGPAEPVASHI